MTSEMMKISIKPDLKYYQITNRIFELFKFKNMEFDNGINNWPIGYKFA